jgi:hypothetical protein
MRTWHDLWPNRGIHKQATLLSAGHTAWAAAAEARAARAAADAGLAEQIRAAHAASRGTYGVRRIHVELAEARRAHCRAGSGLSRHPHSTPRVRRNY